MRRILKATVATGMMALAVAPQALAGEYHVYACRTPSGESAPMDGWSGSVAEGGDYATDTCGEGGGLTAALRGATTHKTNVDLATWEFSMPAFDTMLGATLWRAADADDGEGANATYETWLAGPSESSPFDSCVYQFEFGCTTGVGDPAQPLAEANRVVVPAANLGAHLYVNAACEGSFTDLECPAGVGDAHGYAAAVYLYAADILLEQNAGPAADNVSGELASAATVAGTSDVIFSASDPGAGIWEATFSVDGKVVQSTVPDKNGGCCRDVGEATDGHLVVSVLDAEIVAVISNHRDLEDDTVAAGVIFHYVPVERGGKERAEAAMLELLKGNAELLVLVRYMQILSGEFLERVGMPAINIHHSFLPARSRCAS